jgi:acetyl-CoA C-acetyltransferase
MLKKFRFGYLAPVIGIMKGLTDPIVGQLMGQTAENLAWRFGISRDEMDAFAVESHRRVAAAQDAGHFAEIVPLIDRDGSVYAATTACAGTPRWPASPSSSPSSTRNTAASPPATARRSPTARPGWCWPRRRRWRSTASRRSAASWTASGRPRARADGPRPGACGHAHPAAPRPGLNDLDLWELNEAFAAQVIACLRLAGRRLLPRAPGLPGALGESSRPASTSMAARWRWATRWGRAGRIVLHLLQACAARAASGASPPSASVAVWVAQCWWRPCDGTATLETRTRRRRHRLGHAGRGGRSTNTLGSAVMLSSPACSTSSTASRPPGW